MKLLLLALLFGISAFNLSAQAASPRVKQSDIPKGQAPHPVLVDPRKPSVFITFEKTGEARPLFEGESEKRVWLWLNNNTRFSIDLCYFSVSTLYGDVAVRYDVEADRNSNGSESGRTPRSAPMLNRNPISLPVNNYAAIDSCLVYDLGPGKSVLFSVPREHLKSNGQTTHIAVRFEFEWELEGTIVGSQPLHYVSFSYWNLPARERF